MTTPRIFIVDDHPLFIEGVKKIFSRNKEDFEIVGQACSAKEAFDKLSDIEVEVVLIDLIMPNLNGLDLLLMIKRHFKDTRVIALTASNDTGLLLNVWRNDIDGILTKYCGKKELIKGINKVLAGDRFVGTEVPPFPKESKNNGTTSTNLTKRELQILNILAKNHNRQSAADILGISKNAVDFHCKNIFKKFGKSKMIAVLEEAKRKNVISV